MKICGKRFHGEVGKFRFLNELIKVVSPKVNPCFYAVISVQLLLYVSNTTVLFFVVFLTSCCINFKRIVEQKHQYKGPSVSV